MMFNQQSEENLTMSIAGVESQLSSNEGTQGALRAQLATAEPYSRVIADGQLLTTPETQLKSLQTQYATLTGQYGPDHPDVVKLRNQIQALKTQIGPAQANAQLEAQIADVKTNLAAAKSTQGADHPDVIALQKQLAKLEATLKANGGDSSIKGQKKTDENGDEIDNIKLDADNPAYLEISSQLKSAIAQHKALVKQRDELKAQQEKYRKSIITDPQVEQEMSRLTRDYENSQLRYRELKEKKMSADMNEQLESGRKGQRLEVINPPAIPDDTHPKRILLILGGFVLAIIGGVGGVTLVEATNQNIYGIDHVAQLVGTVPFVSIPHILAGAEKAPSARYKPYVNSTLAILNLLKILLIRFILKPCMSLFVFLRRLKSSKPQ